MSEKTRRDPGATAGIGETMLTQARREKKTAGTLPVAARISRDLYDELKQIADENKVKPGRLVAYAIGFFVKRYKADPQILKFITRRELPRD